jgi:hypothetical protein
MEQPSRIDTTAFLALVVILRSSPQTLLGGAAEPCDEELTSAATERSRHL